MIDAAPDVVSLHSPGRIGFAQDEALGVQLGQAGVALAGAFRQAVEQAYLGRVGQSAQGILSQPLGLGGRLAG